MELVITIEEIDELSDWDKRVKTSHGGNMFQYLWYLKMKHVKKTIVIYKGDKIRALFPLFESIDGSMLQQSTVYVPYGGPLLFPAKKKPKDILVEERKIIDAISKFLLNRYRKVDFSLDVLHHDIVPYIRNHIIPEYRITYVIDVTQDVDVWMAGWNRECRRNYRKAVRNNLVCVVDKDLTMFDFKQAVYWDVGYDDNHDPVENAYNIIKGAIDNNCGEVLVAKLGEEVVGGFFIAWDHRKAYTLYSYYSREHDCGVIPFLYKHVFLYVKENLGLDQIDMEGSVLRKVEDLFIALNTKQEMYFNMHWEKGHDDIYRELYDYE